MFRNAKIQLWNLGFVEAHQNSILRGQGFFVYTRWLKRARGLPSPSVGTQAESKAEVSGSRAETRKGCKEE